MEKDGLIVKFHAEIGATSALHVSKTELSARGGKNRKKPYNVRPIEKCSMPTIGWVKILDTPSKFHFCHQNAKCYLEQKFRADRLTQVLIFLHTMHFVTAGEDERGQSLIT